jgi:hypothetical protein
VAVVLALMAVAEELALKELKVFKDVREFKVPKAFKEPKVYKELKEFKDVKELKEFRVLLVQTELMLQDLIAPMTSLKVYSISTSQLLVLHLSTFKGPPVTLGLLTIT